MNDLMLRPEPIRDSAIILQSQGFRAANAGIRATLAARVRPIRMLRCVTSYQIQSPLPVWASLRCAPALPERIGVLVVPGLPALSTCWRSSRLGHQRVGQPCQRPSTALKEVELRARGASARPFGLDESRLRRSSNGTQSAVDLADPRYYPSAKAAQDGDFTRRGVKPVAKPRGKVRK